MCVCMCACDVRPSCLPVTDVVQMLEEERKELLDLDARRAFTEDIRAVRQVSGEWVELRSHEGF